ncbi:MULTISPECIES: hypothetical protein [unclassified Paludibacterium]|uniref:hypothetical protein n=1 Tax=unclassified Paludibacterium TaxID=2618429 RepID=UPI001C054227|nr:hypothetical protein [Paludibacterium sp. B53371]BEV72194.1 hypothetical protein THUN1379_16760 [Paludibacterium sp. THUN1379]
MKKRHVLTATIMLAALSLSVMADETSAPVPIHRTTAKHRAVKSPPAAKPARIHPTASAAK